MFKDSAPRLLHEHGENKVIAFTRAGLVFVFNFHPTASHFGYRIDAPPGKYRAPSGQRFAELRRPRPAGGRAGAFHALRRGQ
ncbi:MAG: alpha amylase C-terminal domain-containing protein [Desulfobacterales bacterium]|nr:alpha amylase C-terminal domain-containing protein [Desulfobacterales bacterium]